MNKVKHIILSFLVLVIVFAASGPDQVRAEDVSDEDEKVIIIDEKDSDGEYNCSIDLDRESAHKTKAEKLVLPSHVFEIYYDDFYETDDWMVQNYRSLTPNSPKIKTIELDKDNGFLTVVDDILYTSDMRNLLYCPPAKKGEINIPEGVVSIGKCAFADCTGITEVNFPKSLSYIHEAAFGGNTALTTLNISEENYDFLILDNVLFTKDGEDLVIYPSGKKDTAYTVPESVRNIRASAFRGCSFLKNVTLSKILSYIGIEAFRGCTNLKTVTFSEGLTTIASGAFIDCKKLEKLELPNGLDRINEGIVDGCDSLKLVTVPVSVQESEYNVFSGKKAEIYIYSPYFILSGGDDISKLTVYIYKDSMMAEQLKTDKYYRKSMKKAKIKYFSKDYSETVPMTKAQSGAVKGSGKSDTAWYKAGKTEYSISTPDELAGLAELVDKGNSFKNKKITLTADLDLSCYPSWLQIGKSAPFSGSFIGNGHTIYNLRVNRLTESSVGLFGYISGGSVTKLYIVDASVAGNENVGILAGRIEKSSIKKCKVSGKVTGHNEVGGIAGYFNGSRSKKMESCSADVTVNGVSNVGGIAGVINGTNTTKIYKCKNFGNVTGISFTGGIAGISGDKAVLSGCINKGKITGCQSTGGICGKVSNEAKVTECNNNCAVKGHYAVGGLVGSISGGRVENSINSADISGESAIGGLAGNIEDPYQYIDGMSRFMNFIFSCESTGKAGDRSSKSDGFDEQYYVGNGDFNGYCAIIYPELSEIFTYKKNADGGVTITGCKKEKLSEISQPRWCTLTIPSKLGGLEVTKIEGEAFAGKEINVFRTKRDNRYFKAVDGVLYNKDMTKLIACPLLLETDAYDIPATVKYIGDYAFYNKELTDIPDDLNQITLHDGILEIGEYAFYGSRMKSLMIPGSVRSIGKYSFADNDKLQAVYFGEGMGNVEADAFSGCKSLKSASFAKSMKINDAMLKGLKAEQDKAIDDSSQSGSDRLFAICEGELLYYFGSETNVSIPDGVTEIGQWAFAQNNSIKEVIVPKSVTYIGEGAFAECRSLTKINLPENLTSIGYRTFRNCESLKSIKVPNKVEVIGIQVFDGCKKLKKVVLPNTIITIRGYAFRGCEALKNIDLPSELEIIEESAFYGCRELKCAIFGDKLTTIGDHAYYGCYNLEDITFTKSLTSIGRQAFLRTDWISAQHRDDDENYTVVVNNILIYAATDKDVVTVPEGVTSIAGDAFIYNNEHPFSVILPKSLTTICDCAFQRSWLEKIEIPKGVTGIGEMAFYMCDMLHTVTFAGDVPEIGEDAFAGCNKLKNMEEYTQRYDSED